MHFSTVSAVVIATLCATSQAWEGEKIKSCLRPSRAQSLTKKPKKSSPTTTSGPAKPTKTPNTAASPATKASPDAKLLAKACPTRAAVNTETAVLPMVTAVQKH